MNKKIFSLLCAPALFLCGCNTEAAVVNAEWSTFDEGTATYNANYSVPTMTYSINGSSYVATCIVVFPDGSRSSDPNVNLNQPGIYEFIYTVDVDGVIYSKSEHIEIGYPQYYVKNPSASSIRYVDEADVKNFRNSTKTGVYVQLAPNDEFTFTKPIKVSDLDASLMLAEAYVVPNTYKTADFGQLIFKLTDTMDENNYVLCRYYGHYETASNSYSSVHARSSTQGAYVGLHQSDGPRKNDTFGLWCGAPLDGDNTNKADYLDVYDYCTMVFGFDNNTRTVYGTGFNRGNSLEKVVDLDDVSYIDEPWGGFTCDSVRLSIICDGYASSTANFVITKSAVTTKQELIDNEFIDSDEPAITINENEHSFDNGCINCSYRVPTASGYDFIAGACDVKTSVYFNYFAGENSRIQVPMVNGTFVPSVAGVYTVVYSCKDRIGNEAIALRSVNVFDTLPEMIITLPEDKITSGFAGQTVTLSDDIGVSNYSGGYTVRKFAQANGGAEKEINSSLVFEEIGTYTIIYEVTDFLGRTARNSYNLEVADSGKAILAKEITLPKYCISDFQYSLPAINSYKWDGEKLVTSPVTYKVTDSNGTKEYQGGKTFIPKVQYNENKITVDLMTGNEVISTEEITTIVHNQSSHAGANAINLLNYFVTNNATKVFFDTNPDGAADHSYESGIKFNPSFDGAMGIDYVTAQLNHSFSTVVKEFNNFPNNSEFSITLTDSVNKAKTITATLLYKDGNMTFINKDGSTNLIARAFNETGNSFSIGYNDGIFSVDNFTLPVKHFDSGVEFDGFDSDYCYLSFKTSSIPTNASFVIDRISGGQFLYTSRQDKAAPDIITSSSASGLFTYNSIYHYLPAYAGDTLSPNISFTLSVFGPDDSIVKDVNGLALDKVDPTKTYDIKLSEFGKYSFEIVARDSITGNGNKNTILYNVVVLDDFKPTINITSKIQVKAKVNDVVSFPTFTASDNATTADKLIIQKIVLSPSGIYTTLYGTDNAIKVVYEGTYVFTIKVMDEAGNYTSVSFNCVVSK